MEEQYKGHVIRVTTEKDALARQFAASHDMKVKDEIERLARERARLERSVQ